MMGFGTWDHAALKGHFLVLREWKDGRSVQVAKDPATAAGARRPLSHPAGRVRCMQSVQTLPAPSTDYLATRFEPCGGFVEAGELTRSAPTAAGCMTNTGRPMPGFARPVAHRHPAVTTRTRFGQSGPTAGCAGEGMLGHGAPLGGQQKPLSRAPVNNLTGISTAS